MIFYSQSAFKSAIKSKTAIGPIRKDYTAPVQIVGDRQAKFVFSTESVDRDYDVVIQTGIDVTHFLRNPVIFFNHDHDLPIAKCVSVGIENGNLVGVIDFVPADNPAVGAKAEGIYQMCRDGYLSTVSIGFIPLSIEYPDDERNLHDGVNVLTSELVEVSVCGIPSNREALIQQVSAPIIQAELQDIEDKPGKAFRAARLKRILASMN